MKAYVAYKLPNSKETISQFGVASAYTELAEALESDNFIFNSFDNQTNYQLSNLKNCKLSEIEIYFNTDNNVISNQKDYLTNCSELINFLTQNPIDKVILSRIKKIKNTFNPIELFTALNTLYKNTFNYIISIEGVGTWIGSTPEILLTTHKGNFKTVSIAGTKHSESDNWGNKELEEQQIVTDYIANTLMHNSVKFNQSATQTIKAGSVYHLKTTFEGHIQANEFPNLIKALHPTPATCGLPKTNAQQHIKKTERHQRKFYTGFLGPTSKESTNLFVNLRCLEVQKEYSYLYLGGGITSQSLAIDEWHETENKANTLLKAISSLS